LRRQIGRSAILLVLGIATLGYGSLEKRVTVRVEGEPVAVRTFAGTVAGALDRAGVDVGERDLVMPSPAASITEGDVIRVRRAKHIRLIVDGKPRNVVVTALQVQDALEEIELDGALIDHVHPPRSAPVRAGMTITYERAVPLFVHDEGKRKRIITNASTVREVVDELGIKLGKRDYLEPRAGTEPTPRMRIRVMRVGIRTVTEHVTLGYQTILRRVSDLEVGLRKVLQEGIGGLKMQRVRITYVNGEPAERAIVGQKVVRLPRDRIIAIGSGYPGCGACDDGTEVGEATWYSQADGMTAAHKTLPFGTVVRVENLANGRTITVTINDRGPYASGRIIDLSDEAFRRLAPLSKGVIDVRIRW
jgi:uncharacterized protein YabE (DUF348 family)